MFASDERRVMTDGRATFVNPACRKPENGARSMSDPNINPNLQISDAPPTPVSSQRVDRYSRTTPAQAITAAGGIVMLVLGLIGLAKTGLSDGFKLPVTKVAGLTYSPLLALISAGAGLILLGAAFTSRNSSVFFGVLLAVGGVVGLAAPERFESISLLSPYCWLMIAVGAVVVLVNLLMPTITTRKVTYR
jgi:hypothetical protein